MAPAEVEAVRLTPGDLHYLRAPRPFDPWVPAVEVELAESTDDAALRRALDVAMRSHPRFRMRLDDRRWVPLASADDVTIVHPGTGDAASGNSVRAVVADTAFPVDARVPVRVGLDRTRLVVAWRHAVCDGAGGVAFVASILKALAGDLRAYRLETASTRPQIRMWLAALRPAVIAQAMSRARRQSEAAIFAVHGDIEADSAIACWTMGATEQDRVRGAVRESGSTLTAALTVAAARACFACIGDTRLPVRIGIPVNLRPGGGHAPSGNFVGQADLVFVDPPALGDVATVFTRSVAASKATLWALGARSLIPEGMHRRRRGDEPEAARLGRTLFVNNLGIVDAREFPGVRRGWWLAPTAVDSPALTVFSVGGAMSLVVRARLHQGGEELAEHLLQEVRAELDSVLFGVAAG